MSTPRADTIARPNPYAPPRASVRDIVDASAVGVLAEPGTRFVATFLDGLIFGVMVYAPLFALTFTGARGPGETDNGMVAVGMALALVGFTAWAGLTIRYVMLNGQSIAKKLLGIKVVRRDGSPAKLSRVFWLRNFVNGLLSIIPLYSLIEVLFIFGESRQCLHDKIADTIVVNA